MRDCIRKSVEAMTAYVPGEQPTDPAVIKLNTNENPYPPSPGVLAAAAAYAAAGLRRYPDPVCTRLRARIAERHGCGLENVFVGNGSDEVLALCTRAFVENDGTIGYLDPSYSLYPVLAAIRDVATRPIPLRADLGWEPPDGYAVSLFFLTNPNAPTGLLTPREQVRALCDSAAGAVVIDEAYVDFAEEDCVDLALSREHVLVTRTLSKSFSLAGLRVGYAVGAPSLINALFKIKDSYNVDGFSQCVALAALEDVEAMRRNAERIKRTRGRLEAALRQLGYDLQASQANFVWARPPGMPAAELQAELKRRRILIRHFPGALTGAYVRITVGSDEEIDTLVGILGELTPA